MKKTYFLHIIFTYVLNASSISITYANAPSHFRLLYALNRCPSTSPVYFVCPLDSVYLAVHPFQQIRHLNSHKATCPDIQGRRNRFGRPGSCRTNNSSKICIFIDMASHFTNFFKMPYPVF